MTPPIDDIETLRRILANTDALFLDFDGPICQVFAGIPASLVADQLRYVLAEGGHTDLPDDVRTATDPFDVLFYAAKLGQDEARFSEAAFRAQEVEAVQVARPTPGAADLMRAWRVTERPLAVVSNNSVAAVETYLEIQGLRADVDRVSARASADMALLKPSPFLLTEAADGLAVMPSRCALVGDSTTDVQASHAATVSAIGYANKPGKADRLADTGAELIVTSMSSVLAALGKAER